MILPVKADKNALIVKAEYSLYYRLKATEYVELIKSQPIKLSE
jgi:hypothetical protein